MSLIGEAMLKVCCPRRVNYSIYGNTDMPMCFHAITGNLKNEFLILFDNTIEKWRNPEYLYSDDIHGGLKEKLNNKIYELMKEAY